MPYGQFIKILKKRKPEIKNQRSSKHLETEDSSVSFSDALDNEMVLNMGPQHPATHGVFKTTYKSGWRPL
ncbi:MAG: hypothetical protein R2942_14315 [Ignavibacteria bacterium]